MSFLDDIAKYECYDTWPPKQNIHSVDVFKDKAGKRYIIYDWERYVSEPFRKNWANFTDREREIIYILSQARAINEDYGSED